MPTPVRRTFFRRDCVWPIVIATLIFVASSRSRVADVDVPQSDKMAHFAVYGLLATLVCRLGHGWRAAGWALFLASFFGATDELHQAFVPGRTPQLADWIADTCGAAVAVGLYAGWARYRAVLEKPLWPRAARIEKPDGPAKLAA